MSSPDLFVVCKSCGSEVSPYVTECPYCGTRLRKRAPKIERQRTTPEPPAPKRAKQPKPPRADRPPRRRRERSLRLGRLRTDEIPGVRGEATGRPWATIVLVALSFGIWLSLAFFVDDDLAIASIDGDPWRFLTAPFLNASGTAQFACVVGIGVFGWLLERRHGPLVVVVTFLLAGAGGLAAADVLGGQGLLFGGQGGALGLLGAWVVPVLLGRRRGDDDEADLLGVAVIAVVLLLIGVATGTSALAGALGAAIGAVLGLVLAAVRPRVA